MTWRTENSAYVKKGLSVHIYRNGDVKRGFKQRMIGSPAMIQVLNSIEENGFDADAWNLLNQREKNFMYQLNHKCNVKSKLLDKAHLQECNSFIERLRLLEGSLEAGNHSEKIINEILEILDELTSRHQLTKNTSANMKRRLLKFQYNNLMQGHTEGLKHDQ